MKNALIVGGNSGGIGTTIKQALVALPGSVAAPEVSQLDVSDEDSIKEYVDAHGPWDFIIYSAGANELRWARDLSMEDFTTSYAINVFGFALLLGTHKRYFPEHNFSAVAIVSDATRVAMRGSTVYCSSKAALAAVIRNLAREWAPDCRVNGVSPSVVDETPMTNAIDAAVPEFRGWTPEQARQYETSLLPMGRRVRKDEVAHVVIDVLFGPAYLNGSIIEVTGGK